MRPVGRALLLFLNGMHVRAPKRFPRLRLLTPGAAFITGRLRRTCCPPSCSYLTVLIGPPCWPSILLRQGVRFTRVFHRVRSMRVLACRWCCLRGGTYYRHDSKSAVISGWSQPSTPDCPLVGATGVVLVGRVKG